MLRQLARYAEEAGLVAQPGFAARKIHWAIDVDAKGKYQGVADLRENGVARAFPGCPNLTQPELIGGKDGEQRSHFLVETAEVALGLCRSGLTPAKLLRLEAKRRFFLNLLVRSSAEVAALRWLEAGCDFLRAPEQIELAKAALGAAGALPTDSLVILVEGKSVLKTHDWQAWWVRFRASLTPEARHKAANMSRDLLTGDMVAAAVTHPKVRGLRQVGGVRTGDAMLSFDKNAFTSYGLEQGQNAPLGATSSSRVITALEHLATRGHRVSGAKLILWYDGQADRSDPLCPWLDPELPLPLSDPSSRFHYLAISGGGGRVIVRDWLEGDCADLPGHLKRWRADLSMVARNGQGLAGPATLKSVLECLAPDYAEAPTELALSLVRAAVTGGKLPEAALPAFLRAIAAEVMRGMNPIRMGLLRALLVRAGVFAPVSLDITIGDPGYRAGRLLAALQGLAYAQNGEAGAGRVQRCYPSAALRPGPVLCGLLSPALRQLRLLPPGLARIHQDVVRGIWEGEALEERSSLRGQALFALGYYQQIAESRSRAAAAGRDRVQRQLARDFVGDLCDEPY